jgi:hypothetical protein
MFTRLCLVSALAVCPVLTDAQQAASPPPSQVATGPQGDYYTTPDGCTYRRAQAPGYPPAWYLILNPHHIGKPNAHRRCKGML